MKDLTEKIEEELYALLTEVVFLGALPKAKVGRQEVKMIRMLRKTLKWTLAQIGRHYSLSRPQVSAICNNKFWKNA